MEEEMAPPSPTTSTAEDRKRETSSTVSRLKKDCLSFTVSLQESFTYVKAFFLGLAKKVTARNEKEATKVDLQTAKMQVEAADAAEDIKKKINKSM